MNEHILFVIDHLANTGKYTQEELEANEESAYSANDWAAWASAYAAALDASETTYWVDKYFKITGEDKKTYIDKLKGES